MKKLSITFVLVITALMAQAQTFSFGPKVGLNVSNYTGGNIESDALVGAHLGGILNFGIGQNFSIQPEVLFSTQGAKIDVAGSKRDYKTSYVTVPVLFKLKANGGLFVELGPQFGFRTSEDIPDQTIDHFAKNLDLAAALGLGYQANFGLGFGARYIAGLSKVGNFDAGNIGPDFKNSVLQFSIYYAIPVVK
ncbi:outer membrane protein with beta-barrel domain [Dyadobacter jejuensis]|uniref:Outer membrane protein with beta-barrel domain n=1 Tax=Dyadobacter jejuensis TaxID=1082580 RepID=A0A316AL71_9BACT|nr:porin family protein [Dyadobacter jejuensis]PWJ58291.1 outer membrane protein with beta-barrel domain [Dyadobacter jejuensis]